MIAPHLVSIQVGRPRKRGSPGAAHPFDRPWTSSFYKEPVDRPLWLGRLDLEGNEQADREHHGGGDQAALAYAAAHYPSWREELGIPDLGPGGFGENFTVAGLDEGSVSIGDVWALGEARVQVTQPREPCRNIARRFRIEDLTARVLDTGRTGWYLRVLAEGRVEGGLGVEVLERPAPEWTVARALALWYRRRDDREGALALAACPGLSAKWRARLEARSSG